MSERERECKTCRFRNVETTFINKCGFCVNMWMGCVDSGMECTVVHLISFKMHQKFHVNICMHPHHKL